jgi:hypothetical protein
VIPSLREWHETYKDDGLVVIGVHYPEFEYERDLENLKEAVVRLDLPCPIAQDPVIGAGIPGWRISCIFGAVFGFVSTLWVGLNQQVTISD